MMKKKENKRKVVYVINSIGKMGKYHQYVPLPARFRKYVKRGIPYKVTLEEI